MYILSTGCQWRAIPKGLPPRSTVYDYFELWSRDGTLDRIHDHALREMPRAGLAGRKPTVAIIDSQSVKSAEKGGPRSTRRAMMRVRRIKGKKRHLLVDTQGLLMHAIVHAANVQDRDGGVWLMAVLFARYPFLVKLYADGGYQGPSVPRCDQK